MYTLPKEDKTIKLLKQILLFTFLLISANIQFIISIIFSVFQGLKNILGLFLHSMLYSMILGLVSILPVVSKIDILLDAMVKGKFFEPSSNYLVELIITTIFVFIFSSFINGFIELLFCVFHNEKKFIRVFEFQPSCFSIQMTICSFIALWIATTMDSFAQSSEANKALLGISIFLFFSFLLTAAYNHFVYSKKIVSNIYQDALKYWNAYKD